MACAIPLCKDQACGLNRLLEVCSRESRNMGLIAQNTSPTHTYNTDVNFASLDACAVDILPRHAGVSIAPISHPP